jgi:glycosyltransferase involved in cell wall biosynthesis
VRIAALVESEDHVCCRYRLAAFQASFARAGHLLKIHPLPRHPLGRLRIGHDLADADAVIIQRKLLPPWTIALLRRRVNRLIFDFDDAVWLRDSFSSRGFDDTRRANRFRSTVAACDLVVAGNDYLADKAAEYISHDRIVVIPTCVDPTIYPVSQHQNHTTPQLVWVGSESTLKGLQQFTQTLSDVGRAVPGIRLKLICDRFLQIPHMPVDTCLWNLDCETEEIASADVGISWVPDDPWSRGKCGLKILQYQAAGLPVVANPVGVHSDMVRNGITGYTASSTEEWVAAITRLAKKSDLRQQLGLAGRQQVEQHYSIETGSRSWIIALEKIAGIPQLRKSG